MSAPDWFEAAIATPTQSCLAEVAGCPIHYRLWPGAEAAGRPGMVFVHGSAAHSHWWDHIAPAFAGDHAVAALDLSGMGESGRRPRYRIELFAEEIGGVIDAAGFRAPVVVAHSFGAFAATHLALARPGAVGLLVVVDSHLAVPPGLRLPIHHPFTAAQRVYPTPEDALARFRLIPPQPVPEARILDHIGRHSLRAVEGGWTWKFEGVQLSEENVGQAMFLAMEAALPRVTAPVVLIHGAQSVLVSAEIARHLAACFTPPAPVVAIPGGHHHLMLDQPLALIAALRGILAGRALAQ